MGYNQAEWVLAVKEVPNIESGPKKAIEALGARIFPEKVYIHAHFHIPEDMYVLAEEKLGKHGFVLQTEHPVYCESGDQAGYEVFERRMPIIEGRECDTLSELMKVGVLMSGGAGIPHVHIAIPVHNREKILTALKDFGYFPREQR